MIEVRCTLTLRTHNWIYWPLQLQFNFKHCGIDPGSILLGCVLIKCTVLNAKVYRVLKT